MTSGRKDADRSGRRIRHRLDRGTAVGAVGRDSIRHADAMPGNVVVECGWGRLIFAHTFNDAETLADRLRQETPGARDIAFYVQDPHVVLSKAPQELFLDPSHTFRLWMENYRAPRRRPRGFSVRRINTREDLDAVNAVYASRRMVRVDPSFFETTGKEPHLTYYVAVDLETETVIGTVTGVDHVLAYADPDGGSSLWSLAVHPQARHAGIGQALVCALAEYYQARGRAYMDLSVMHDNTAAIALYEKLGFQRLPTFTLKTKNSINEPLFLGPDPESAMNPYARIITSEARRRGIAVEVVDTEAGFFRLKHGGRSIVCRESLSQLTDAVAMSRCDDKSVTRRILDRAGLRVPAQRVVDGTEADDVFLTMNGAIVVKPARGEQGRGISVDVRDPAQMRAAIEMARSHCDTVLLEELAPGDDVRLIVINFHLVAAAVRRPPEVVGDGVTRIRDLIDAQSRRRAASTDGESRIPMDAETERCIGLAGYTLDTVLPKGELVQCRKTANLHTGGTIHDVTDHVHRLVVDAAVNAARALDIPVVGLDFMMPDPAGPNYVVIEANERPGLANHEPQPTAERFVDLLFPATMPTELKDV